MDAFNNNTNKPIDSKSAKIDYRKLSQEELKMRVQGRLSWGDYETIENMGIDVAYLKETGNIRFLQ